MADSFPRLTIPSLSKQDREYWEDSSGDDSTGGSGPVARVKETADSDDGELDSPQYDADSEVEESKFSPAQPLNEYLTSLLLFRSIIAHNIAR